MTDKKNEKWLDERLTQATDLGKVRFDAQEWKQKYILNESRESSFPYTRMKPHKNVWRLIMKSRITRYSAAAVIVLAMALVLLGPGAPGNGSVVLADVQQKVAEIDTMIIRGQKTFKHPGENGAVFEFDGVKCEFDIVKHFSKQHGFTEEGYAEGNLFYRLTFNLPKRQTLIVFPRYKKYITFASLDGVAKTMESFTTPNGVLNLLLDTEYKKLGRDKIDGVEVEGFEFQDVEPIKKLLPGVVLDIQDYTGKVWIGVEEQMPVRIEGDLVIGKSFMSMFQDLNLHEVSNLDKYNVEIDPERFDVKAPEGYTQLTLTDILLLIPAEAKAGIAGLGVLPAGFVVWKKRRRRRATASRS